tara:strand:+ start:283 stop:951 length:669 start_codon:yes stop_codon:yes gene_type:complete
MQDVVKYMPDNPPTLEHEQILNSRGYNLVAGIDEAGRGPLAGPVVAGAVIIPSTVSYNFLSQVRDSKQLTPNKRNKIFQNLVASNIYWSYGIASSEEIDQLGILNATKKAMTAALGKLTPEPDFLLIDAVSLTYMNKPYMSLIKGDQISMSIATASIVAKVIRDKLMELAEQQYPGYGFGQHKGYPTKLHVSNLYRLGATPIHRTSFAPVRKVVENSSNNPV